MQTGLIVIWDIKGIVSLGILALVRGGHGMGIASPTQVDEIRDDRQLNTLLSNEYQFRGRCKPVVICEGVLVQTQQYSDSHSGTTNFWQEIQLPSLRREIVSNDPAGS